MMKNCEKAMKNYIFSVCLALIGACADVLSHAVDFIAEHAGDFE